MSSLCQTPELFICILYQNIIFSDSTSYFLEMSMLIILVGTMTQLRMGWVALYFLVWGPGGVNMPSLCQNPEFCACLVDICWERADLLASHLCCFTLCRLDCLCSFCVWCLGKEVEFDYIVSRSLPFHICFDRELLFWSFQPLIFLKWLFLLNR